MYLKIIRFLFLFLWILSGGAFLCKSQDTLQLDKNKNYQKIEWVAEFPIPPKDRDINFLRRLYNLILGNEEGLLKPISLVVDKTGNIIIADQGQKTIIEVKNHTGSVSKFFKKTHRDFPSLVGTCLYKENSILFTDSYLNKIFLGDENKHSAKDLNCSVDLLQPTGIAYSSVTKEIWVVETAAHRIAVLNEQGELIRRIGKRGKNPGEFNFPTFIWIDKFGIIYVIDSLNFRVQIFDQTGNIKYIFGESGDGSGDFARPKGIAVDSEGNIYVSDALFHTIQIFDSSGNYLSGFGSQGRGKGQFWMPTGIFIDKNDNIYVADSYNARIQKFKRVKKEDCED